MPGASVKQFDYHETIRVAVEQIENNLKHLYNISKKSVALLLLQGDE